MRTLEITDKCFDAWHWETAYRKSEFSEWTSNYLSISFLMPNIEESQIGDPPNSQWETYNWHVDNQRQVKTRIVDGLIENYSQFINFEGGNRDQLPDEIIGESELLAMVNLCGITVKAKTGSSGLHLVGYSFNGDLDQEHGVGVVMDGEVYVDSGHMDKAFMD